MCLGTNNKFKNNLQRYWLDKLLLSFSKIFLRLKMIHYKRRDKDTIWLKISFLCWEDMNFLWILCLLITIIVKKSHLKMCLSNLNKWENMFQNLQFKNLKRVKNKIKNYLNKRKNKTDMTHYLILSLFPYNAKKKTKN